MCRSVEVITTIKRVILVLLILILAFLVWSLLFFKTPSSTTLETTKTTTTDNLGREVVTTIYVDKDGHIQFASDKGYASVRRTYNEDGKVVLEEYLGSSAEPVMLPAGYAAIERVYTDGLNTTITYLGLDHQPIVINNGYSSIHRTYNNLRLADTDTYWIGDQQVTRTQGYASLHRIYGEGSDAKRIVRQEYRDLDGDLVVNTSGYAYLTRSYNDLGKVETELYYDTTGKPAILSLGQSGFTRLYDEEGRITSTTYLGADGEPINTKNGYATIKNIYGGEEVKYLYFDSSGVSTTGTHGEYGYEMVDGKKILLNADGEPLQRLDIFLNSNPIAVLILGAVFTILALIVPGCWKIVFLLFYLVFIYLMTLAWREGIDVVKRELFWSYKQFMSSAGLRKEIINNVFLFVPLGCILSRLLGSSKIWLAILICLAVSAAVETIQLAGEMGTFEFDDMISNGIGGVIGAMIATILPTRDYTRDSTHDYTRSEGKSDSTRSEGRSNSTRSEGIR